MADDRKAELLAHLDAHRQEAMTQGLAVRDWGFGVLILCLPEYGEAEQLLLKDAPPEVPPPP